MVRAVFSVEPAALRTAMDAGVQTWMNTFQIANSGHAQKKETLNSVVFVKIIHAKNSVIS